jgi:hypothetical protein
MERNFRVQLLMNDTYQVLNADDDSVAYQSNLANCEAYIRLIARKWLFLMFYNVVQIRLVA